MKALLSLAMVVVALVLSGCGPQWMVLKQASPNPMTSKSAFKVERGMFDATFHVGNKTEAEWMSEKGAETHDRWDGDKAAMADNFAEGFASERDDLLLTKAGGAGVFTVRARYIQYEPGFYAVVASSPTELDADVEFLDASGNIVDVIRIRVKHGGFSSGEGARRCSERIGVLAAKYLKKRVGS